MWYMPEMVSCILPRCDFGCIAALQEHSETLAWICKERKAKTKENKGGVLNCSSIVSKLNSLTESIESKLSCLADTIKDQDRIIRKSAVEQDEILTELGEFQGRNMGLLNECCEEIMEKSKYSVRR